MKLLFVGHSHLVAPFNAWRRRLVPGLELGHVALNRAQYQPAIDPGSGALNPAIVRDLSAAVERLSPNGVALTLGGNEHMHLGLVRQQPPFVIGCRPGPGEVLVPSAVFTRLLAARMAPRVDLARLLLPHLPRPIFWLGPPPPISDERVILERNERFRELLAQSGITRADTRARLWQLQDALQAANARELGVRYMRAPAAAMTDDGFLVPEAWGDDAVHGSPWYGATVLAELLAAREMQAA